MRQFFGLYLPLWAVYTVSYHFWVYPAFWDTTLFLSPLLLLDALSCGLGVFYLHLHLNRRRRYRSSKRKWGNVFREKELAKVQETVAQFQTLEDAANCGQCRGNGSVISAHETAARTCPACGGNGFANGRINRPFHIKRGDRAHHFFGFDAETGEPFFLTGESLFQTTAVYGIQGSGKTKRCAMLTQMQLLQDAHTSILYFSLKDRDAAGFASLAREHGWTVTYLSSISLLNVFDRWSHLEEGLRRGMAAAGYRSRESFWFDRTLQLLQQEYQETLRHQPSARLGPTLRNVILNLEREAKEGNNVKADQVAVADVSSYLRELDDPLSSTRWIYDAGPSDYAPRTGGETVGKAGGVDWSPMAQPKNLIIVPPPGTSRAALVAATALKFAYLLWFDENKTQWLQSRPEYRSCKAMLQDEGDNFVIVSPTRGRDDIYATKTWRESGHSAWIYTQSRESLRFAIGKEHADAFFAVVGNSLTFSIPDDEVAKFIRQLPEYEFMQRVTNLHRTANKYGDHDNLLMGDVRVSRGESLQVVKGPWITGELFQQLPQGCALLQQAGQRPRVLWMPYFDHVTFIEP